MDASAPHFHQATVVLNAAAGGSRAAALAEELGGCMARVGFQAEIVMAREGGLSEALDRACASPGGLVVAAGGDGTQSAVAARLAGTGRVQGVLPLGTLNHFAKDLGIPPGLEDAVRVLAEGEPLAVDVGEVNGRVFINNSSIGLYPLMVRERDRQQATQGHGKWRALAVAGWRVTRRVHHFDVRVEAEEGALARRASSLFIGNNEYTLEGLDVGSRASLADGQLVLYLTPPASRLQLFMLAARAVLGKLERSGAVERLHGPAFVIRTHHHRLKVALDGEVEEFAVPLRYRLRRGALRVMAPRKGLIT